MRSARRWNAFTVQHCLQPCEKVHPGEEVRGLTMVYWKSSFPPPGPEQGFQASALLLHRRCP